jgi:hypothetical protein
VNEGKTTPKGTSRGGAVCRHPVEWVKVASVYELKGTKKERLFAKAMCRKCGRELMRCVK